MMVAEPPESERNEGPPLAAETAIEARERARREPAAAKRLSAWLKGYKPLPGVPENWISCNPNWSPDGKRIAFVRLESQQTE